MENLINEADCCEVTTGACSCDPWMEDEGKMWGVHAVNSQSSLSSLSFSLSLPHAHTHTCSSDSLSLFSFSVPLAPHSSPRRDQQSMRLLIEARMFRSVAAPLWTAARMCHWLRTDLFTSLGIKAEDGAETDRGYLCGGTLLVFVSTSLMGDKLAGDT